MSDRYDELMTGLYTGAVPDWLPGAKRPVFLRESVRRRCELGSALRQNWPCTMFFARCVLSEDFALSVFQHWPAYCRVATEVTTGLYLGLKHAIHEAGTAPALWELFQYETLHVTTGSCTVEIPRLAKDRLISAGLDGQEVYRFELRVPELWSRMKLYHAALAPAHFVRDYEVVHGATYVARSRRNDRWLLDDVTDAFAQ